MSKLETQYQGEDVIIVGADSDCLSVLQSFVLGEDLGQHSKWVVIVVLREMLGRSSKACYKAYPELRSTLQNHSNFHVSERLAVYCMGWLSVWMFL